MRIFNFLFGSREGQSAQDYCVRAKKKFERQDFAPEDLAEVSAFFEGLDAYPFCYRLPQRRSAAESDRHRRVAEAGREVYADRRLARLWRLTPLFRLGSAGRKPRQCIHAAR